MDAKRIGRGRVVTVVHDDSAATRGRELHLGECCTASIVAANAPERRALGRDPGTIERCTLVLAKSFINAIASSINADQQSAISQARGFCIFRNQKTAVCLFKGKLGLPASPYQLALAPARRQRIHTKPFLISAEVQPRMRPNRCATTLCGFSYRVSLRKHR